MESRGQKRAEEAEVLRADKRPCSNLDFRPRSPRVVPDVIRNGDMDTSSSASASSSRSEEEEDPGRDSGYASCDSDDGDPRHSSLRALQRSRSPNDHVRLRSALACLNQATEPSAQVAALTELCEVLSFCAEGSMSSLLAESLSPVLVRLARNQSNHPDIMLLAIRALTYMCDAFPRASAALVRHEAVVALCQRLMAIEYMDVAEQCLQALEKISRDQPHACLQAGAIMAVLSYIDFFSTSVQRVAVSTVVNICKKLPADCSPPFMDAVPILCNLLQYEDRQLVENVAICLIKIAERASQSSEMLDELCKHGLINKASRLIHLNSHTTLSQPLYNGLIGLLVKLCSGSNLAFRTLYELNKYSILKDILASHDLSHGTSFAYVVDGQGNQVSEILKLLSELLPPVAKDQEGHSQMQISEKETFIMEHPDLFHKFGSDVMPILVQVVNTGASIYICYGCLSVIYKLIYFSNSDMLVELLRDVDIPSFLAGVFTRTDHHVLMMALHIAETILLKHSDLFLNSFIKEGVFFAIDALMATEKCPQSMFPKFNVVQLPLENSQKLIPKVSLRCLCYAFDTGQGPQSSETGNCMLEKDSVQNLAKHIKNSYFATKLNVSDKGLTDILEKLRALSADLNNLMHVAAHKDDSLTQEGQFSCVVRKLIEALNGKEHVSNFEFIESGLVGSLAKYLSNGHDLTEEVEIQSKFENDDIVVKRFELFGKMLLSSSDAAEELPLLNLIQKLQGALSSLEDFPVILIRQSRQKNSYAVVPNGRCISYPCLKVRFLKREGETGLREYSDNALSVDPFSSLDAIEGFLLPKVRIIETEKVEAVCQSLGAVESIGFESPRDVRTIQWETSGLLDSDDTPMDLLEMQEQEQEQEANVSQSSSGGVLDSGKTVSAETSSNNSHTTTPSLGVNHSPGDQISMGNQYPASYSNKYGAPKLVFYLEGQQLDQKFTLYQAILQQSLKAGPGTDTSAKLWSQVYTLSYGKSMETEVGECQQYSKESDSSSLLDESRMQYTSFFSSVLDCALAAVVDQSSPTYGILYLLKILEGVNRFGFYLMSCERMHTFAQGLIDNLDDIKVVVPSVPPHEFISSKLTEKLEQQMRDSLAVSVGGLPLWCNQLMLSCPFLFSFEAKCKYFKLAAFGTQQVQRSPPLHSNPRSGDRQANPGSSARKKFMVNRERILDCASEMMDLYASAKLPIEVVYNEEVGTGLGPTLEFYTLVSHEFQKSGLGMWRGDHSSSDAGKSVMSPFGLFPRPWPSTSETSDGMQFADVIKQFVLLGQVVAKAFQDGRVLDLPFSKAFYKLILQQELNLYDIQSFDPELGRALIEFKAIIRRNENMKSNCGESSSHASEVCFRDSKIEDLCLDFTLPGYPEYHLSFHQDNKMVNLANLEEYITLTVDATLHSGISRQVEAFKCGFNKVFPIHHLQIFTEEEIERLLCGEHDFLNVNELLDHVKFDHGYTASSLPILHLLEIIREFDYEERRAFLQFVTGAPRLPPGGLASLSPKLTIVRKHCSSSADADLPSVMTCANYLKLPSYSSKEKMKEKLLYAITEGQGSFHLS